jgi:hypothetical protein
VEFFCFRIQVTSWLVAYQFRRTYPSHSSHVILLGYYIFVVVFLLRNTAKVRRGFIFVVGLSVQVHTPEFLVESCNIPRTTSPWCSFTFTVPSLIECTSLEAYESQTTVLDASIRQTGRTLTFTATSRVLTSYYVLTRLFIYLIKISHAVSLIFILNWPIVLFWFIIVRNIVFCKLRCSCGFSLVEEWYIVLCSPV